MNTTKNVILHYFRGADGKPELKVAESGVIGFGHAGLTLDLADVFE